MQWVALKENNPELREPKSFMIGSNMLFALEGDTIILGSKHIYALILRELLPLSSKVFHCTNIFEKL